MSEQVKVAGVWRPIEMTDGDIVKLFQSGEQGDKNYQQFDGKWFVLDESPEAIAEARQETVISGLEDILKHCEDQVTNLIEANARLTAALAKVTAQRDRLLDEAKAMLGDLTGKYGINEYVCAKAHVHPYDYREQGLTEAIAACEQGGSNGK